MKQIKLCLWFFCFFFWLFLCPVRGQYAPAAGLPGTTAIHKDSSIFIGWADGCLVERGWLDIANTSLGSVSYGLETNATGPADGVVVSLGDSGVATLSFSIPITDLPGPDFAVFENGFSFEFLEFGLVQVSSNGTDFYTFPAHSLTPVDIQKGAFDALNPEWVNNLAGKYEVNYGVPFDLSELSSIPGLDISAVTHVRIVDVIGDVASYGLKDTAGNYINDPYPTAFVSGGFDLDAVGVIHNLQSHVKQHFSIVSMYPNPAKDILIVIASSPISQIEIFYSSGVKCFTAGYFGTSEVTINLDGWQQGIYFGRIYSENRIETSIFSVIK
jgi:hypothetical protein